MYHAGFSKEYRAIDTLWIEGIVMLHLICLKCRKKYGGYLQAFKEDFESWLSFKG